MIVLAPSFKRTLYPKIGDPPSEDEGGHVTVAAVPTVVEATAVTNTPAGGRGTVAAGGGGEGKAPGGGGGEGTAPEGGGGEGTAPPPVVNELLGAEAELGPTAFKATIAHVYSVEGCSPVKPPMPEEQTLPEQAVEAEKVWGPTEAPPEVLTQATRYLKMGLPPLKAGAVQEIVAVEEVEELAVEAAALVGLPGSVAGVGLGGGIGEGTGIGVGLGED